MEWKEMLEAEDLREAGRMVARRSGVNGVTWRRVVVGEVIVIDPLLRLLEGPRIVA